jgi:hypothetical protein
MGEKTCGGLTMNPIAKMPLYVKWVPAASYRETSKDTLLPVLNTSSRTNSIRMILFKTSS